MTVLTLLQDILGPYKTFSNGENYFQCPFCQSQKKKFAFNEHNLKWHCWHCGSKGGHVIWLLKKLNISKNVLEKFKDILGEHEVRRYKFTEVKATLALPPEYKPLWKVEKSYQYLHAITYLKARGITSEDILRYRMGYCETGTYAGRVIVPSYDQNNQLNYFTGRSFFDGGMKYKNPPVSKNVVIFENLIDWNEPVILCEGMFDAIALRQNAVPLMGKTIPKSLQKTLVENRVKNVVVFLDADARKEALYLEHKLQQYGINTKLVLTKEKDASEMGFTESWTGIKEAKSTDYKDFITQRLQNI